MRKNIVVLDQEHSLLVAKFPFALRSKHTQHGGTTASAANIDVNPGFLQVASVVLVQLAQISTVSSICAAISTTSNFQEAR